MTTDIPERNIVIKIKTGRLQGASEVFPHAKRAFQMWQICIDQRRRLQRTLSIISLGTALSITPVGINATPAAATADPVLATYDGGRITLSDLEEYTREMPLAQRISFAKGSGEWREFMCGNLAKMTALTSQAKTMGLHLDPGYLRARDYFINEYMCFLVLRDRITNQMDVSLPAQKQEYETNLADFWVSPTVSLRVIRSRDADSISSAARELKAGHKFQDVEQQYSQVSPRYKGEILGPFPSTEEHTIIPPPDEVIQAAFKLQPGQTTGPLKVGNYHFIIKTEERVPGRQMSQVEAAEQLESRLRDAQSQKLIPGLIDRIQQELGVVVDEALFAAPRTNPDDLLATIGAVKIHRQEYNDLNGNVRGPAVYIANMMPTPLKRFVLPYMISEWAKVHGYLDRGEAQKALYYYDLQHLAARVEFQIAEKIAPLPTDAELKQRFQENIDEFRQSGTPEPRFEDHKQEMLDAIIQQRAPEAEHKVKHLVLAQLNFRMTEHPQCLNPTAFEALVAGAKQIPADARLLEISPAKLPTTADGSTPYVTIGRAPEWNLSLGLASGETTTVKVSGPAPLLQNADDYAAVPAFQKWTDLCRFDTISLKRHAVDKALGNFMAKYNNNVQVASRIKFSYAADDPTSPSDCLIVYAATPVDPAVKDGAVMKYSGYSGDVTKRRLGEPEDKCLTCPQLEQASVATPEVTTSAVTTSETLSQKGDLL